MSFLVESILFQRLGVFVSACFMDLPYRMEFSEVSFVASFIKSDFLLRRSVFSYDWNHANM